MSKQTVGEHEVVNVESISIYKLKKLGDLILKELDKSENDQTLDASFGVLRAKLLNLSVKLNPVGEDILKSLAHQLTQLKNKNRATIAFMRGLVSELLDLYQAGKVSYAVSAMKSEPLKEKPQAGFISQRMKAASLVHDPRNLRKGYTPKKGNGK